MLFKTKTVKTRIIEHNLRNEALRVFRLFSESYKNEDKEKTGKSFDFSGLVAEAGLEPTTSGL